MERVNKSRGDTFWFSYVEQQQIEQLPAELDEALQDYNCLSQLSDGFIQHGEQWRAVRLVMYDAAQEMSGMVPDDIDMQALAQLTYQLAAGELAYRQRYNPLDESQLAWGLEGFLYMLSKPLHDRLATEADEAYRALCLANNQAILCEQTTASSIYLRGCLLGHQSGIDYIVACQQDPSYDWLLTELDIDMHDPEQVDAIAAHYYFDTVRNEQDAYDVGCEYMTKLIGLPAETLDRFSDMVDQYSRNQDDVLVGNEHLKALCDLRHQIESYQRLSVQDVAVICEQTGIVNLHRYNESQLERMRQLLAGDEQLLEQLHRQPVMLCVLDGLNDQTDMLANLPAAVDGSSATTLYFELSSPEHSLQDLQVYMDVLSQQSINYETVFIGSHGLGESHSFWAGNEVISVADGSDDADIEAVVPTQAVATCQAMQRLLAGLVPDERGQATVVLLACYQGARSTTTADSMIEQLASLAAVQGASPARYTVFGATAKIPDCATTEDFYRYVATGQLAAAHVDLHGVSRYQTAVTPGLLSPKTRRQPGGR